MTGLDAKLIGIVDSAILAHSGELPPRLDYRSRKYVDRSPSRIKLDRLRSVYGIRNVAAYGR